MTFLESETYPRIYLPCSPTPSNKGGKYNLASKRSKILALLGKSTLTRV